MSYEPTKGSQVEAVAKLMAKGMDRLQIREMLGLKHDAAWYALKKREKKAKVKPRRKVKREAPVAQESYLVECIVHAATGQFRVFAQEHDFIETYQRAIAAARSTS